MNILTPFEKKEVHRYKDVFFVGTEASKEKRNMHNVLSKNNNNGYDTNDGYYKVVVGDHLNYRYEMLSPLDRGAFGQVVRCFDHLNKVEVAIKINRNSVYDHTSSKNEIAILKKLKAGYFNEGDFDEEERMNAFRDRIVEFKDSFFFRNHYVKTIINHLVYCI